MKRRFKEPAIIFGDGINGLGMARNLGCAGARVYCVTKKIDPASFGRRSLTHIIMPKCARESISWSD